MIEISTIQDIRHIDSKLIGGFSGKQLISFAIGGIAGFISFLITHILLIALIVTLIVITIGVFKKGELTAIEYLHLIWDKQQQPRIRSYKSKNIISEIEKQCKIYKSPKKKRS